MIDKDLLEILVCPKCKKAVQKQDAGPGDSAQAWLMCVGCGLRYPVRDGIPIMLIDEAVAPAGPTRQG